MEYSVELSFSVLSDDSLIEENARQGIKNISAPFDFIESTSKEILKEKEKVIANSGMRVDTAHPRFGLYNSPDSLVNQYTTQRIHYLEQLKEGFERMSIMGARVAPLHTGGCCLPLAPEWSLELCAESLQYILPAAKDAGIILAMENTFFYMPQRWDGGAVSNRRPQEHVEVEYDDIGKLCKLIDMMDSKNIKGCFDAGHAHYLGDLQNDHTQMGDRIALYHIHDNSKDRDMHLPPGYGTLNWELLGKLINSNCKASPAFIEASPWAMGTNGHMIKETRALLNGGRHGENRHCMKCGYLILNDEQGQFCNC